MNFLRRFLGKGRPSAEDTHALHLYVRCLHCGSPVHTRIDLRNDLNPEYGDELVEGYLLVKEMMDAKCFRLMRAEVRFDPNRREVSRAIEGGQFISREEYERLSHQQNANHPAA